MTAPRLLNSRAALAAGGVGAAVFVLVETGIGALAGDRGRGRMRMTAGIALIRRRCRTIHQTSSGSRSLSHSFGGEGLRPGLNVAGAQPTLGR